MTESVRALSVQTLRLGSDLQFSCKNLSIDVQTYNPITVARDGQVMGTHELTGHPNQKNYASD